MLLSIRAMLCVVLLSLSVLVWGVGDASAREMRINGDHASIQMGFLVGQRNYTNTIFAREDGEDDRGSRFQSIYQRPGFSNVFNTGLQWNALLRMSHVRMSVGFALPFSLLQPGDVQLEHEIDGKKELVRIQSLQPYEFRFGLGGEYSWGRFTPYLDLMGTIHVVHTQMSIEEISLDYASTHFSFSTRAGVRIRLRSYFYVDVYGEFGFMGSLTWNSGVSVGFRTP